MKMIALEAIFGAYTAREIADKHGVKPHEVQSWTCLLLSQAEEALYKTSPE